MMVRRTQRPRQRMMASKRQLIRLVATVLRKPLQMGHLMKAILERLKPKTRLQMTTLNKIRSPIALMVNKTTIALTLRQRRTKSRGQLILVRKVLKRKMGQHQPRRLRVKTIKTKSMVAILKPVKTRRIKNNCRKRQVKLILLRLQITKTLTVQQEKRQIAARQQVTKMVARALVTHQAMSRS